MALLNTATLYSAIKPSMNLSTVPVHHENTCKYETWWGEKWTICLHCSSAWMPGKDKTVAAEGYL